MAFPDLRDQKQRRDPEQMLKHRGSGVPRMNALGHLCELKRITEQDEVVGCRPDRKSVRHRDLPCLVQEQIIER